MFLLLLFIFLQMPSPRSLLIEEDARAENPAALIRAARSQDRNLQRLAVRALGRFERPELAEFVRPLLSSPDPRVRAEAVNALGQMNAPIDFLQLISEEKDASVRAVIYQTIGRVRTPPEGAEGYLTRGLVDLQVQARTGAVKGLEALYRTHRQVKPSPDAIGALRRVARGTIAPHVRELALLALNAAGDVDTATLQSSMADLDPQVRRLGVIGSKQWKDDPSHIVRYDALRIAGNCDRAVAALADESDHVVLLAIDQLGNGCAAGPLIQMADGGKDWRRQSRALVSLAKVDLEAARQRLPKFVTHERWQARVYAAAAAKVLKDQAALSALLRDSHANVVEAALSTPADAVRALSNSDYGLVLTAARTLRGSTELSSAVPVLLSALERITAEKKATSRDPRMEILQRLREAGGEGIAARLRPLLADIDPAVAKLAAEIITEKTGTAVQPQTTRYKTAELPAEEYMQGLFGATAVIRMKEAGSITLQLIPDEAPVTVATFARLAEKGYYNGLTFHRIAPNFVLQGGSPGANEYVGQGDFMRDEIGLLSHLRGTVGISTRGRDTGDAQIFINLVDNFRLDHNYTVFARVIEGMENVDKVQEGDIIESIEIKRSSPLPGGGER